MRRAFYIVDAPGSADASGRLLADVGLDGVPPRTFPCRRVQPPRLMPPPGGDQMNDIGGFHTAGGFGGRIDRPTDVVATDGDRIGITVVVRAPTADR